MENAHSRECYSLSAGLALGLVMLEVMNAGNFYITQLGDELGTGFCFFAVITESRF